MTSDLNGDRRDHPRGGAQVRPERDAPRRPRRDPQPGTARRARVRGARGTVGSGRELPVPAGPAVLAARLPIIPNESCRADAACQRIGRPSVLITTDDAGAIFLAEHGDSLREWFLFPAPPADLPRRLAGKYSMHELCRELDVPSPQATVPSSLDEARDFASMAGFPVIAKLTTPWRGPRARAAQHLDHSCRGGTGRVGVRARGEHRPDAAGVHPGGAGPGLVLPRVLRHGRRCRPAFTGVKDRSYPAHAGLTSLGHSALNIPLRDQVTGAVGRDRYRGITDLDLRFDQRDGQYKLLDFNPRLGAQFRLFTTGTGLDVVRAAYLDLTGQAVAAERDDAGPAVPGRELRPDRRARLLAQRGAGTEVLGDFPARSRRGRLVRPGRSAALRADVPAHGLAGSAAASAVAAQPGVRPRCARRGRASLPSRAPGRPDSPGSPAGPARHSTEFNTQGERV